MSKHKIIVDTHYLIWDLQGHPNFNHRIQSLYADKENDLYICTISYWEIAMLVGKNRIKINQSVEVVCKDMQAYRNYKTLDISPQIAGKVAKYAHLINGDPADRIIAATAMVEGAKLLTRDQNLISLPFVDTITQSSILI